MKQVEDIIIPARHGRAFTVKSGQILRIFPMVDGQVGDVVLYNANDKKEWFHVGQSWALNNLLGSWSSKSLKYFYSKPPRENVMATVLADTFANHWGNCGGRCSHRLYEIRDKIAPGGHRSCQQNLTEALAPHGLTGDDIGDIFNVFMTIDLNTDGTFKMKRSNVTTKDYIDVRADMDLLVAISACPADSAPVNGGECGPLGARIFEE